MPLPTYDELTLPLLTLAAEHEREYAVSDLRANLSQQLQLTTEQLTVQPPN